MTEREKPVYTVSAYSEPVLVRIDGRACFQNSASLKAFASRMISEGKTRFVFDFGRCTSMDSTFLGVLAGAALELRKATDGQGSLILASLGQRNLELIRNMGLQHLLEIDTNGTSRDFEGCDQCLSVRDQSEQANARDVLEAHENLIAADEGNRRKFQDVIAFLKNRVDQN